MKQIISICVAITLLCFVGFKLPAQSNGVDWLKKSTAVVDTTNALAVDITMNIIAGKLTGDLIESNKGSFNKSPNGSYSVLGDLISIQNNNKAVVVDNDNNNIIVLENSPAKQPVDFLSIHNQLKPYIDTIYAIESAVGYVDIVCIYKRAIAVPYERVDVRIDKSTFLPLKVNMFLVEGIPLYEDELKGQKPIISIEYSNWKLNPVINKNLFDIEKYTVKKDGEWLGVGIYKNYDITTLN